MTQERKEWLQWHWEWTVQPGLVIGAMFMALVVVLGCIGRG